jgi:hypothetical protein
MPACNGAFEPQGSRRSDHQRTARPPLVQAPSTWTVSCAVLDGQPDGLAVQPSSARLAADPLRGRGTGSADTAMDTGQRAAATAAETRHPAGRCGADVRTGAGCGTAARGSARADAHRRASGRTARRTPVRTLPTPIVRERPRSGHRAGHLRPPEWTPAASLDTWLDGPLGHLGQAVSTPGRACPPRGGTTGRGRRVGGRCGVQPAPGARCTCPASRARSCPRTTVIAGHASAQASANDTPSNASPWASSACQQPITAPVCGARHPDCHHTPVNLSGVGRLKPTGPAAHRARGHTPAVAGPAGRR